MSRRKHGKTTFVNIKDASGDIQVFVNKTSLGETAYEIFSKFDVVHYCVPNISSRVSRTATFTISNILAPSLLKMGMQGGIEEYIKKEEGFRSGTYVYKGMLTNVILGSMFDLPHKDLNLII